MPSTRCVAATLLPNTGHIRDDLLYLARESQEFFARDPFMGKLITKLIAEIKTKPGIARGFADKVIAPRIQEFRHIVERAQERGEVRADLDATFILHLIFLSLVYGNLFVEFIDPAARIYEPTTLVDVLLRGIGTRSAFPDE